MAKILVTGMAGFIGSHTAKALSERGDEVIGLDNFNDYYDPKLKEDRLNIFLKDHKLRVYRHDLDDIGALRKIFQDHKFDKVCHLAAQAGVRYSLERPEIYISSNITGTQNLLDLCREFGIRDFIFASSSSVYGNNEKVPFAETDPVDQPISLYAATKKANELQAHVYHHLFGINCRGLRFFTVYGPWGRPDMAYYKFADLIRAGKPIEIYNNGSLRRDFTYIDDIVGGILKAIDSGFAYEIINLGNHQPVELGNFVSVLEKSLGMTAQKIFREMQPGDVLATYADIGKAKKMLDWEPYTGIEEGLRKFADWYKEYSS